MKTILGRVVIAAVLWTSSGVEASEIRRFRFDLTIQAPFNIYGDVSSSEIAAFTGKTFEGYFSYDVASAYAYMTEFDQNTQTTKKRYARANALLEIPDLGLYSMPGWDWQIVLDTPSTSGSQGLDVFHLWFRMTGQSWNGLAPANVDIIFQDDSHTALESADLPSLLSDNQYTYRLSYISFGNRSTSIIWTASIDNVGAVPEPDASTLALTALGLLRLCIRRRSKMPINNSARHF